MTVLHFWAHKIDSDYAAETGLGWCKTCGGAEGSLPEHCPQRRMTRYEEGEVYAGRLDFRRSEGGWTTWTKTREWEIRRMLT